MRVKLSKGLLILLVVLQFVAPLVHAHSGNNFARFGLHLPSFEIYSVADDYTAPQFQSADTLAGLADTIVSISTGIENPQNLDDFSPALYFPSEPLIFSPVLQSCEINFSPHVVLAFKSSFYSPQSPRAPPV